MIVPRFWAEAKVRHREGSRQLTVRRFGWSDASADEAMRHAETRASEALTKLRAGERIEKRERKVGYAGADGLPIREEIVQAFDDGVLTRNGYGALCLNVPQVLFADVDFDDGPDETRDWPLNGALTVAGAIGVGLLTRSFVDALVALPVLAILVSVVRLGLRRALVQAGGGDEPIARKRIEAYVEKHPEARLRIYRTPAGLRVLAMHRTFDPTSEESRALFQTIGADPTYVRMCELQRCFRARVSPKPWRVGLRERMRPRPGVWPVTSPSNLALRSRWVTRYEAAAQGHASCRFVEEIGGESVHPAAERVRALHDRLSHAESELPIA